jgi:hypothetical protein
MTPVGGPEPAFDLPRIVEVFNRHGIAYIAIGGVSGLLHGMVHYVTQDVDMMVMSTKVNLELVIKALLNAYPGKGDFDKLATFEHVPLATYRRTSEVVLGARLSRSQAASRKRCPTSSRARTLRSKTGSTSRTRPYVPGPTCPALRARPYVPRFSNSSRA